MSLALELPPLAAPRSGGSRSFAILAIAAVGVALFAGDGTLAPLALPAVLLAAVAVVLAARRPASDASLPAAWFALPVGSVVAQWLGGVSLQASLQPPAWAFLVTLASVGGSVALRDRPRMAVPLMLAGFVVLAAAGIHSYANPVVDVFVFQQDATAELLAGRNPYHTRFRSPYPESAGFYGPGVIGPDGFLTYSFPYPPLTLLLDSPFRLLGDIRFAHVASLAAAAVLLTRIAPGAAGHFAAMLLLFSPRTIYVIQAGWTEPQMILGVALFAWSAIRSPKHLWIAIGLLLASKQTSVLLLPMLAIVATRGGFVSWKTLAKAVLLAATVTVPFALLDVEAFVRSVVLWQFRQPMRADALSLSAATLQLFGTPLPGVLPFAFAIAVAWVGRRLSDRPAGFFLVAAGVYLAFFATNKQAFCNYYLLVIGLLVTSLAAGEATTDAKPG